MNYLRERDSGGSSGGGISFAGALQLIFIVLKLIGVINWSWVWVLSPTWISIGLLLIVLILIFVYNLFADD